MKPPRAIKQIIHASQASRTLLYMKLRYGYAKTQRSVTEPEAPNKIFKTQIELQK